MYARPPFRLAERYGEVRVRSSYITVFSPLKRLRNAHPPYPPLIPTPTHPLPTHPPPTPLPTPTHPQLHSFLFITLVFSPGLPVLVWFFVAYCAVRKRIYCISDDIIMIGYHFLFSSPFGRVWVAEFGGWWVGVTSIYPGCRLGTSWTSTCSSTSASR